MGYCDLDDARRHHAALKAILQRYAGEGVDFRALRLVVDLCRGAAEAVSDRYCQEKIRLVAEYGAELLGHGEHARWSRGTVSGVEFLRQQALDALELYLSRLYSLEVTRHADARAAARPAA